MNSRIETLLAALNSGDSSNLPKPQSEIEEYLSALITGETNIPEPTSRIGAYLSTLCKNGGGGSGGGELDIYIEGAPTLVRSNATKIADSAFDSMETLKTIDFPNATTIGYRAFINCYNLTTINLPDAVKIEENAFMGCGYLSEISLPNVTHLGDNAFLDCKNSTYVYLPKVEYIGMYAMKTVGQNHYPTSVDPSKLFIYDFPNLKEVDYEAFCGSPLYALVLRREEMCVINLTAIRSTPILDAYGMPRGFGGGIYVPTSLYEQYVAQFVPQAMSLGVDEATAQHMISICLHKVEDYTVDGTLTGEIDESKIFEV